MEEKNIDNTRKYNALRDNYDDRVQNGAICIDENRVSSGAICVDLE